MTEQEWLESTKPGPMLGFLRSRLSARKVRLFGCGFLRLIWQQLDGKEGSQQAVVVAERFADGEATGTELRKAMRTAEATAEAWSDPALVEPVRQAVDTTSDDAWEFFERVYYETTEEFAEPDIESPRSRKLVKERQAARHGLYVHLLRDFFGNPFRPITLDPTWLTPTVVSLAQAAYDNLLLPAGALDPDRLAVLADALEEAGCHATDVLGHCRGPGPHTRGCFVVDALLGKT
jgi:hypothetical protein